MATLRRDLRLGGAIVVGLGSILGTGVFVSIGLAAGVAGPAVVLAVFAAALVAACNGLNSAQLAASHPVSGGAYEYGYRYLHPWAGYTAGWLFLLAKSASAATAALGFAGYVLNAFGASNPGYRIALALVAVVALTLLAAGGLRRTHWLNAAIVALTLAALGAFVFGGLPLLARQHMTHFLPFTYSPAVEGAAWARFLEATALMFVAYTGYGRIATMGEEVHDPARTIPKAVIATLAVSFALYFGVALVAVGTVGVGAFAGAVQGAAAPLEVVARDFNVPGLAPLVALGAITAMLGVLLNLILGLSRVLLAMARRGDMPSALAKVEERNATPRRAVFVMGAVVALLVLPGSLSLAWSFSACTVLLYYGINNACALALPAESRRYPRWLPAVGLAACFFLAWWVDPAVWGAMLGLIVVGWAWRAGTHALGKKAQE